jgi:pimeloyl-ACP methyl ester carboxylesterase
MKKFLLVFILLGCQNSDNEYEYIVKNDSFRSSIKIGKFAKLNSGYTYYEYLNYNDSVETLVFIHGFSVPSYIWDITYYEAIRRGYNVLRMDLYGRGFSDNPETFYNDNLFANQVIELIEYLQIKEKVTLIGLSNGGRVVSQIANNKPNILNRLVYVSSSGFGVLKNTNDSISVQEVEVEDFIRKNYPSIAAGQMNDFKDPSKFEGWDTKYEELLKYKGFARGLLSTSKNHVSLDSIHLILADSNINLYAIWGADDVVVSYNLVEDRVKKLLPEMENYIFDNCGHLPHMEHEERFNDLLFNKILK